jgi:hypothetical protein
VLASVVAAADPDARRASRATTPVTHWSRKWPSECRKLTVTVGEGGTSDVSRVTCPACLQLVRKRHRVARELLTIAKKHSGPESIADAERLLAEAERDAMAAKKTDPKDVKTEKFTRNLRVVLKNDEVVERAKRSAFLLGEIQQKETERDAAKKQANAHIEELASEMHRLSLEVRDGAAYRDVPCVRNYLYKTGTVEERRTDTNELLTERAMTEREKQLELELKAPNGKKDAAAQAKALSDEVAKDVTDKATPLPTEKKRKPRKPKATAGASAQA